MLIRITLKTSAGSLDQEEYVVEEGLECSEQVISFIQDHTLALHPGDSIVIEEVE